MTPRRVLRVALPLVTLAPLLTGCLATSVDDGDDPRFGPGAFALARVTAYAPPERANATGEGYVFTASGIARVPGGDLPSTLDAPVVPVYAGANVPSVVPPDLSDARVFPLPHGLIQDLERAVAGLTLHPQVRPASELYGAHDPDRVIAYPAAEEVPRGTGVQPGDVVALQAYWNENRQMWKSRVVDVREDTMRVEHLAEADGTFRAGEHDARIVSANATGIRVDFNHPLAGKALRFNVTLERVFAAPVAGVQLPAANVVLLNGTETTIPSPAEPTLLYFMATWCSVCKEQTPHVRGFAEHAEGVRTIVVTTDPTETVTDMEAYRDAHERDGAPAPWEWARDTRGDAARRMTITTIPRTILVDAEGHVLLDENGIAPTSELLQVLTQSRAESPNGGTRS